MTANKKKKTLSRRNFIARGGGALVSLFLGTGCSSDNNNVIGPVVSDLPEPPQPEPPPPPEDRVDVIVVGAGPVSYTHLTLPTILLV